MKYKAALETPRQIFITEQLEAAHGDWCTLIRQLAASHTGCKWKWLDHPTYLTNVAKYKGTHKSALVWAFCKSHRGDAGGSLTGIKHVYSPKDLAKQFDVIDVKFSKNCGPAEGNTWSRCKKHSQCVMLVVANYMSCLCCAECFLFVVSVIMCVLRVFELARRC